MNCARVALRDPASALLPGSLLLAVALVAALRAGPGGGPPVALAVAASLRPAAEAAAADFTARTGRRVEVRAGGSEHLLAQLAREPCDVFLPADSGYLDRARALGLVGPPTRLATMHAVAVARRPLNWAALIDPASRVALARPESAAIGRMTREQLTHSGRWGELDRAVAASPDTVTACVTAVRLGAADAAVVWDAVARAEPGLVASGLPELAGVRAEVAAAACTRGDAERAEALIAFLANDGKMHFARAGFAPP